MKKHNIFTLILIFVCLISGCKPVIYEPDPSEYIEWDGSYFYYGNYRCKSNLKDEEIYLNEVEYEENIYSIDEVYDFKYVENKLHMSFSINVGIEKDLEKRSAYMIYSLDNEETEYLYLSEYNGFSYEIDLYNILEIKDTYTIFASTGRISKLDLTLNKIEYSECESYEVKSNYAVIKSNNELFASTLDDFKFYQIMSLPNIRQNFNYFIHNINGKPFLQIIYSSVSFINDRSFLASSITYYDFNTKEFSELVKLEDCKCLSIDSDKTDIFILGEETYIEYNPYTSDDKHLEYKSFKHNNILYTVTINNEKLELKELYSFKNNEEYNINKFEDNIIHLSKRTLNKPINHVYYNRIDSSIVYFDIDKFDFINKENHDYYDKINITQDNNYKYYFKTKKEQCFMCGPNFHYYFFRLNTSNNEEGLLAYFSSYSKCPIFETYFIYNNHYTNMGLEIFVKHN